MTLELLGPLAVLALIDSTSFGTLLIPIWFMLTPGRVRVGRLFVFLGTVGVFYFAVGVALLSGAGALLGPAGELLETPWGTRTQFVVGVGLFAWSFYLGRKKPEGAATGGRVMRWRERVMGERTGRGTVVGLMGLALAAVTLELATMLPYLGAIGLLSTAELGAAARIGTLAAYCAVMILPAVLLLGLRLLARRWIEPLLTRIARWMERSGAETTAWIVGIVGFLVARDALGRLPELNSLLGGIGG